jgi:hypothetical protein
MLGCRHRAPERQLAQYPPAFGSLRQQVVIASRGLPAAAPDRRRADHALDVTIRPDPRPAAPLKREFGMGCC